MGTNNSNFLKTTSNTGENPNSKIGIVIIFLIILQSYLDPLISIVFGTDITKFTNLLYIHTISSYIIIVLSIIILHSYGMDIFQDHFSLWLIVLTCFLRTSMGCNNEIIYKGILMFLGFILANFIIRNRKSLKTPSLKSIFIPLLWSVGTVVSLSLIRVFLAPNHGILPSNLVAYLINMTAYQLSFVTVIEEACFRGSLYGFLVLNGFNENKAYFIQAILFWGSHYLKIADPILFFILVPVYTLSATLMIKKYKMLYLTIIMHTLNNVFGGVLVALF